MKLLFDENLSPKLPRLLQSQFPDSAHVRDCGLKGHTDQAIWEYARVNGFTLVSKDGDFYEGSLAAGAPPKLVWLRLGNCTRDDLFNLLLKHENDLRAMESGGESVLLLPARQQRP
jgi:predicted nuclease of predicted toxin-antitoxin system